MKEHVFQLRHSYLEQLLIADLLCCFLRVGESKIANLKYLKDYHVEEGSVLCYVLKCSASPRKCTIWEERLRLGVRKKNLSVRDYSLLLQPLAKQRLGGHLLGFLLTVCDCPR